MKFNSHFCLSMGQKGGFKWAHELYQASLQVDKSLLYIPVQLFTWVSVNGQIEIFFMHHCLQ